LFHREIYCATGLGVVYLLSNRDFSTGKHEIMRNKKGAKVEKRSFPNLRRFHVPHSFMFSCSKVWRKE
jgi:hypothetical protein